jgi:hypothetical protein
MAITVSASPASARSTLAEKITLTVTGAAATTEYILDDGGTSTSKHCFWTDGSGEATVVFQARGNPQVRTYSLRPCSEYNGTTTAAATCTVNITS